MTERCGMPLLPASVQSMAGLPADTPVLLAFSGGADSVALLHALADYSRKEGFALTLAHVDHGIRGEEATRDRLFCRAQAERYGLELCVLEADVPALAQASGRGLEEEARAVRYAFFSKLMRQKKIPLLVTAHHADDQLETVLFHFARGTGGAGLCGMSPLRAFSDGFLVRPLLARTKRDILAYCTAHELPYVTDSTNSDVCYARNRIRAEVVPVLESLFPGIQNRTAQLCARLREDERLLSSLASMLLEEHSTERGVSIAALRAASEPVRSRALMLWARRHCGAMPEAVHIAALQRLCMGETPHAQVALPCDRIAVAEGEWLRVRRRFVQAKEAYRIPLALGMCEVGVTDFRILTEKWSDEIKVHNLSTAPYIILNGDFDIINSNAYWRPRREGERLLMRGMHRQLRKLQAAARIPVYLRDSLPLLCDDDGVLWAPFVGWRDGVCATLDPAAADDGAVWIRVLLSREA